MTKLRISPDLALPIEAVTEAIGFLGRRGSGKSYAAQKLAEQFHSAGAQFIALDPVGNWWALRLAADGKSPGLPITIFGGLQGDVPLESNAGKMVADVIVDRGISAVIDVSQFESDSAKARFARDFCDRFYFRKKSSPSAVFLFLEEAQEFIPQQPGSEETHMLNAFTRLAKLGRNFGIGIGMLSQRPQEVHKKVLNLCELLFVFQLAGTHERKAVKAWIGDKGIEGEDIDAELPKLERGHPHAWSPAWLKTSRIIEIGKKETFDASSTPKVGAAAAPVRELSPIDLERLRKDMAASIEKAKADDPKELRKEIAALKAENKRLASAPAKSIEKPEKPVTVIDQRAIDRAVATAVKPLGDRLATIKRTVSKVVVAGRAFVDVLGSLESIDFDVAAPTNRNGNGNGHASHEQKPVVRTESRTPRPIAAPHRSVSSNENLAKGEHIVLRAIAQYPDGVERDQLTVLTGYKRSTRDAYIQRLQTAGRIEVNGATITATDDGVAALGDSFEPLPTGEALREYWLNRLPEGERRVLEVVLAGKGEPVDRDAISEESDYKRSTRDAYIQRLTSRRLVESVGKAGVRASATLFEES